MKIESQAGHTKQKCAPKSVPKGVPKDISEGAPKEICKEKHLATLENSHAKIHKEIRLAILFSGNGSNLENLVNHQSAMQKELSAQGINAHFVLAISNNKNAYGIERCARLGLRCEVIEHKEFATRLEFENALSDALTRNRIDIVVLAGFMRILGAKIVQDFTFINIHPSFLPLHKGAHAIKDSFEGAEDFGGVSVHWVSEELDSGAIIAQEKVHKQSGENLESFEKRIHELEYKLYPKALICAIKQYAKNLDEK